MFKPCSNCGVTGNKRLAEVLSLLLRLVCSLQNSSSGNTRSTWLRPNVLASSNSVTTVGLRRPRSKSLMYC